MFTVNESQIKGVHIFEVIGRMDGDTAPELGRQMDAALDKAIHQLVLDLNGVDYMSSPGLREIVRIYKRAQSAGGDLRLANPSDRVLTVLQLAGLDRAMKLYTSSLEAVDSFSAASPIK